MTRNKRIRASQSDQQLKSWRTDLSASTDFEDATVHTESECSIPHSLVRSYSLKLSETSKEERILKDRNAKQRKYPGRSIESIRSIPANRGGDASPSKEMTLLTKNIVIGGRDDANNLDAMVNLGITHVLNVAQQVYNFHEEHFIYENIPILDTPGVDLRAHYNTARDFLKRVEAAEGRVLVHCVSGVSRSVSLVIMYLMKEHKLRLRDAYEYIRSCRPFIRPNDGFKLQLAKMEIEIFGNSTIARNGGKAWDFYEWNEIRNTVPYIDPETIRFNSNLPSQLCTIQ